jgi:hypothetical protein
MRAPLDFGLEPRRDGAVMGFDACGAIISRAYDPSVGARGTGSNPNLVIWRELRLKTSV